MLLEKDNKPQKYVSNLVQHQKQQLRTTPPFRQCTFDIILQKCPLGKDIPQSINHVRRSSELQSQVLQTYKAMKQRLTNQNHFQFWFLVKKVIFNFLELIGNNKVKLFPKLTGITRVSIKHSQTKTKFSKHGKQLKKK